MAVWEFVGDLLFDWVFGACGFVVMGVIGKRGIEAIVTCMDDT